MRLLGKRARSTPAGKSGSSVSARAHKRGSKPPPPPPPGSGKCTGKSDDDEPQPRGAPGWALGLAAAVATTAPMPAAAKSVSKEVDDVIPVVANICFAALLGYLIAKVLKAIAALAATLGLVAFLAMEVFNEAGWNWKDLEGKVDGALDDKSLRRYDVPGIRRKATRLMEDLSSKIPDFRAFCGGFVLGLVK